MDFKYSNELILYKIYRQLAIHNAPTFVLDLFVPFLVVNGKYFFVESIWNKINSVQLRRGCCPHFEEATITLEKECVDCGKNFTVNIDSKTKKIISKGVFYGGVIRFGIGMWAASKMSGINSDGTIHWVRVQPIYKELYYKLKDFKRLLFHQYKDVEYWECPKCNNPSI